MAEYEAALELLQIFLVAATAQTPRKRFHEHVDEAWFDNVMAAFQTQAWGYFQLGLHNPVTAGLDYLAIAFFNLGYEARGPALVWRVNDEEEP